LGAYESSPTTFINDKIEDKVIYYDPVSKNIYLSKAEKVEIFDINGRRVLSENNISGSLNTNMLNNGVYIISFTTNSKNIVHKFLKY
jgi:hypothetical protein